MATAADIAAWIGAAAWLPQIASWVHARFVRPLVRIMPDRSVSVGFTGYGPIFNVRVAIASERRDAILDKIAVTLRHEGGDQHELAWVSHREKFSQITDNQGNYQVVERDQPAIALQVHTAILAEKFILFQEPSFREKARPLVERVEEAHRKLPL